MTDHDDPVPYHGVAEMLDGPSLAMSEVKQVSAEDAGRAYVRSICIAAAEQWSKLRELMANGGDKDSRVPIENAIRWLETGVGDFYVIESIN